MKTLAWIAAYSIFWLGGAVTGAALGIEWYRENHPPTITLQRACPIPARPAMLFACPMTKRDIIQYDIFCRGRTRSDAVKPKGE